MLGVHGVTSINERIIKGKLEGRTPKQFYIIKMMWDLRKISNRESNGLASDREE